jgi:putative transposase
MASSAGTATLVKGVNGVVLAIHRRALGRQGALGAQIVKKCQQRLANVDEIVLSLSAKGLAAGGISARISQIYRASVSKETISRITDTVVAEMQNWAAAR